jgi:Zn-dependent protease with chaperone function
MQTAWDGSYLDGRSAARQRVTIHTMADGLQITTERGVTLEWPYGDLRQTQGFHAGEQVRLERGEEFAEVLLISDPAFLTVLHQTAPERTTHLHNPVYRTTRVRLTFLAGLAVIGFLIVQYLWGIPGLAGIVAPFVPVSWEERLGREVVNSLAPEKERCQDAALTRIVNDITTSLTATLPSNPYTFQVVVTNTPFVNAFAAPGGYVVVFRGLLERTDTPEQLAGVLAHEAQHILQRHATRTILEHASTGLLLAAITGDFTGAMTYGLEGARTLGILQYSRSHEEQADVEGMKMVMAAGIDPAEMIAFYLVLMGKQRGPSGLWDYLSTHPRNEERIQKLQSLGTASPGSPASKPVKLLPHMDWHAVRMLCQHDT